MITLIDYGMGNLGSLENMIKKVGGEARITSDPEVLLNSEKLILPGVGHFDHAMKKIKESGIFDALNVVVKKKKRPLLAICLGAQLVTGSSEEGTEKGFGWVKGKTVKFQLDKKYRIPHMGWNDVEIKKKSHLFKDIPNEPCFYFVHSFHLTVENREDILTETEYGYCFTSAIEHENIFALQYHPEKSHKFGMSVMKNFVEL